MVDSIETRIVQSAELVWKQVSSGNPRVSCHVASEFGSNANDHRHAIRSSLQQSLSSVAKENLDSLVDLKKVPRLKTYAISISHCPSLGGFVYAEKYTPQLAIGFDIELISRVTFPIAARVLPHEVERELKAVILQKETSLPAQVWAAKEAAIKCFANSFEDVTPLTSSAGVHFGNVAIKTFEPIQMSAETRDTFLDAHQFTAKFTSVPRLFAKGIVRKTDQFTAAVAMIYSAPENLEK